MTPELDPNQPPNINHTVKEDRRQHLPLQLDRVEVKGSIVCS